MGMPVTPSGPSRAGPMLENAAQDSIAAARGQTRYVRPPEYEPAQLTDAERAEAEKAAQGGKVLCHFCAAVHPLPSTPACPRLVSVELDGDGKVKSATFRTDTKWQARVVLAEDLEEGEPSGS
jgi:hypothetical protein